MADKWTTSQARLSQVLEKRELWEELCISTIACSSMHTPSSRGYTLLQSRLAARSMSRTAGPGNSCTNKGPEHGEGKDEGIWDRFSEARERTQEDMSHCTHDIGTEGFGVCGTG